MSAPAGSVQILVTRRPTCCLCDHGNAEVQGIRFVRSHNSSIQRVAGAGLLNLVSLTYRSLLCNENRSALLASVRIQPRLQCHKLTLISHDPFSSSLDFIAMTALTPPCSG